jgi:hypothetical protein
MMNGALLQLVETATKPMLTTLMIQRAASSVRAGGAFQACCCYAAVPRQRA